MDQGPSRFSDHESIRGSSLLEIFGDVGHEVFNIDISSSNSYELPMVIASYGD